MRNQDSKVVTSVIVISSSIEVMHVTSSSRNVSSEVSTRGPFERIWLRLFSKRSRARVVRTVLISCSRPRPAPLGAGRGRKHENLKLI